MIPPKIVSKDGKKITFSHYCMGVCNSECCRVGFLVLTNEEKKLFNKDRFNKKGLYSLDGCCEHLLKGNSCNIYNKRPAVCRRYSFIFKDKKIFASNYCPLVNEMKNDKSFKMNYYDKIAQGYDELYKEEQLAKLAIISETNIIHKEDKLLDVGCGTAFSFDYFEIKEAVGIDPSKKLIEQYDGKHKVLVGPAENLPFDDSTFNVVISITAIQNFDDINKGLKEMLRVGTERFALTYLKKSLKSEKIESEIKEVFSDFEILRLEEEKDIIFLATK